MLKSLFALLVVIFGVQPNYMTGTYWKGRPVRGYGPCETQVVQKPFVPQVPGRVTVIVECPLFASVSTAALFASQYVRENHLGVIRLVGGDDPPYKGEKRMRWFLVLAPKML